jgi:hypothetical protein
MQMAITFVCWGYEPVWTIDEGVDYPRLVWENKPGELITVPSVLYGGGTGEPEDPYLIYTAQQLNMIGLNSCHLDKHFKLMADVDLGAFTGIRFNIIGIDYRNPFSGVFDGNGRKIFNFTYTSTDIIYMGLFRFVQGASAEIKNLGMIDPNIDIGKRFGVGSLVGELEYGTISNCYIEGGTVSGDDYVGGLVGINYYGTIDSCYSTGSISGDERVGGLVGENYHSTSGNCYSTGSVSGDRYVGGLVGYNNHSTIANSYSSGGVSGDEDVGGLVGYEYRSTIANSYSSGSVSGDRYVGGFVGRNRYGTISNSYAKGGASGYIYVGGLAGSNYADGTITNSYSTASVTGERSVGGLVGNNEGTITNCYSTGGVSGYNLVGGLVGENYDYSIDSASFWDIETSGQTTSAGGTGLPTAEMQMQITFLDVGWDFVGEAVNGIKDVWFIGQQDYPRLWWEGMQVPMKLTPRKLNCRSEGNWLKARLTLPEGFTVEDVDADRPAVLHSFGFDSATLYVFVNKDKLVEIHADFERQALCSLADNWPDEFTVVGLLTDGNIFLGTSAVRIKHPGMNVIQDLAMYWLNEDCVHPDFCDGIDVNRDSLVNLPDYALLLNTQVEFVSNE